MQREAILSAELSTQFKQAYEAIAGSLVIPDWYQNLPKEPQSIDEAQRIAGLATIWAQARTSFAFWADFPEGEPTAGSTGTPAIFPLPGGGVGAVSSTRCVYPGRAAFHGTGLAPDLPVAPTIAGLAAGRDEALEAAIAALKA